jgi:hypothetical protein
MPTPPPTPKLTRRYLELKDRQSADRLFDAEEISAHVLAAEFNAAVTEFRDFSALPTRTFYDQDPEGRDLEKDPKSDSRTYGWGMAMKRGVVVIVDGDPGLSFAYVDVRSSPLGPNRTAEAEGHSVH